MDSGVGRLRYLDGLRALAVLGVMVCHSVAGAPWALSVLSRPANSGATWWFVVLAAHGGHGVDLFFVLSGFCLSYPVLGRLRGNGTTAFDLVGFFAKRIVRIVPPFYAAIVLTFAGLLVALHFGIAIPGSTNPLTGPLDVLRAMLFLDRNTRLANVSFWTLFVELRWYLFFPLVLVLYVRSARAFFALMAGCVVAYNFTTFRAIDIAALPAFMMGIVAADWQLHGHRLVKYAPLLTAVFFDVALLLEPFASIPSRYGGADEVGGFQQANVGWQLASFFLVVSVGRFSALARVFELAPLRATGVAAYGIYLVHLPLMSLWIDRIAPRAGALASFCGAVALGLAGGFLFSFLAERPFLADPLRQRMVNALRRPIARILVFGGVPQIFSLTSGRGYSPDRPIARAPDAPVAVTTSS